ncbi:hypothetical protein [Bradyrhizobium sp. Ai1a-2]|uniref:hypothetical protein n=1 Tax=Bradyrhizobium sp. Ai1a-2 TaxID=196490 RepID=UPI000404E98D|nr:hypothetical protein [Bradyrhizobium sp. Ai1a-2]
MKLVRMSERKVGLLVPLPSGLHVIDIADSLGVFAPHDPLSNGVLNGALKGGCDWSLIVKHWAHLRSPLKRLANLAAASPDHSRLAMRPFKEQFQIDDAVDQIVAIDITDTEPLEGQDPTGRRAMARQFSELHENKIGRDAPPTAGAAQVIDFSHHKQMGDA